MTSINMSLWRVAITVLACLLTNVVVRGQEVGIDRPGKDLRPGFDLQRSDPELCRSACNNDANCKAYTYVKPGFQGPNARCWLKSEIPPAVRNDCCISGTRRVTAESMGVVGEYELTAAQASGLEIGTDRPGADLNSFDLPQPDPNLCQSACQQNASCRAFTYVKPGVQGATARCWLKSSVPNPVPSDCCISGVVRGAGQTGEATFTKMRLTPEIEAVSPTGPDGDAAVNTDGPIVITGRNFSSDPSKNKIIVGNWAANAVSPPAGGDVLAELKVETAAAGRIEGIVTANLPKDRYLVWVFVELRGYSNPVPVRFGPKLLAPAPVPTLISIDPALPGFKTTVHGAGFIAGSEFEVQGAFRSDASFVSATQLETTIPLYVKPGTYPMNIRMNFGTSNQAIVTVLDPKPLNLYWFELDDNGFPLNPRWGVQLLQTPPDMWPVKTPESEKYWPTITELVHKGNELTFATAHVGWDPDLSSVTDQPLGRYTGMFGCGPHVNWEFAVTYEGRLRWSSKSDVGKDDDYNFYLFPQDGVGSTTKPNQWTPKENVGSIVVEFDSDETIDNFHTTWWNEFHDAVDNNNAKAHQMADKDAIVTGLFGLDCAHNCEWSELHPAWAMAIHTQDDPNDDRWSMFVRNWGNEGYCGTQQHPLFLPEQGPDRYRYAFRLPWRAGATNVQVVNEEFKCRDVGEEGPYVTPILGQAVIVSFYLPQPDKGPRINGELRLKWTGSAPATGPTQTVFANLMTALSGAPQKIGEEHDVFDNILRTVPVERRATFEAEVKTAFTKQPVLSDTGRPKTTRDGATSSTAHPAAAKHVLLGVPDPVAESRVAEVHAALARARSEPVSNFVRRADGKAAEAISLEQGVDRRGQDYKNFPIQTGPEGCQQACANDPNCRAFTWVRAGMQGPQAVCWLKNAVPQPVKDPDCVSGVKK